MENVKQLLGNYIAFANDEYDAAKDADALLIATEWGVFRNPDFKKLKSLLKAAVIFDGRNLYELDQMRSEGFYYECVGREVVGA